MERLLQSLVDGLANGSLYALIALGYTMVYGILQFINFAHGDVFVVGAWTSLTIATLLLGKSGTTPALWAVPIVLLAAMLICAGLALLIERLAYRPLRSAPRLNVLITAIGISLFLQNFGQLPFAFGTQPKPMPPLLGESRAWIAGGVRIAVLDVVAFGVAIVLMLALEYLVNRTRTGRAMRATSASFKNAALMGINVDGIISLTFAIGAALAGAAGFLHALKFPSLQATASYSWVLLGLKAFIAAVVGGIGNLRGAMVGGFLIGLLEQLAVRINGDLRDVFVFGLLIFVLLVKPSGLFGRTTIEKV